MPNLEELPATTVTSCPVCGARVQIRFDDRIRNWLVEHEGQATPECAPTLKRILWPNLAG